MIVHTDHHEGSLEEFGDSTWLPSETDSVAIPNDKLTGEEWMAIIEFLNEFRPDSLERAGWMSFKGDTDKNERLGLIFDLMSDVADELDVIGQEDEITVPEGVLLVQWPETYQDAFNNELVELRIGDYGARRDNLGDWWIGTSEYGVSLENDDEFWDNFGQLCERLLSSQSLTNIDSNPSIQDSVSAAA